MVLELRGALLHEGRRALLLVPGAAEQGDAAIFVDDPLVQTVLHSVFHTLFDAGYRDGSPMGDDARHLQSRLQAAAPSGAQLIRQTHPKGLLGGDGQAGHHELLGVAGAHQPGETLGTAIAGLHAQAALRQGDLDVFVENPDVAGHGQLQPAPEGVPVDRAEHRPGEAGDALEHLSAEHAVLAAGSAGPGLELLDVRPSTEDARQTAAQYHCPQAGLEL